MSLLWGGEKFALEWQDIEEFTRFNQAIMAHYNSVASKLKDGIYEPLFLEGYLPETDLLLVDEWCEGFFRGLSLWGEMSPTDMKQLEANITPMRYFASEEGMEALSLMSDSEIYQQQENILLNVEKLYHHFVKPVKTADTTFIHATPKVGRNEP